jgi:hypothetical protein
VIGEAIVVLLVDDVVSLDDGFDYERNRSSSSLVRPCDECKSVNSVVKSDVVRP